MNPNWKKIARVCGTIAALCLGVCWLAKASAADEIARLAKVMEWKAGTVVADIGAGDGRFSFEAAAKVGPTGRVYATEIDEEKLKELRDQVKRRNLTNVIVVTSKEADTGLADGCCDAIFLRRVYHHLTKPEEFDARMAAALRPGGRLAIIDFPPRAGLDKVEGIPANRGGHGIAEKLVVEELTAAGLKMEREVKEWPSDDYCIIFVKR
jgi:ubiquinone/menaquinone biosynthesis C-methylase UbiE